MLVISEIEALFISKTRTKRSPDSESIQRWKLAFSGDLSTPFASSTKLPSILTCNWALHELCLKHVSCRELWVLFRRNCVVDAQNNCRMSNKNDCWQSYEGISWTGLGACTCPGNNSDCHWIRLQTTYNKCIFELNNDASWHVQLNSLAQYSANRRGSGLAPISTSNPLTTNEERLARINAQEQRKVAEQEIEKRRREQFKKDNEGANMDNHGNIQNYKKNIQELRQKPTPSTQQLSQEATIKFKNVILKDEKPRKNLAKTRPINPSNGISRKEKLDNENNFNEQKEQQNKVSEQNKHQQNNHQNIIAKQTREKHTNEHLVTQAEIPPTAKITEFIEKVDQNREENQNKEEKPLVGSNITFDLTNSNEQKQQQTRWSCTQTAKMCKAQPRC
uniref:GDNF/GAS1 domain-containing protein n=1 Tax=Meloidogyne javanica TaxID=6303 RepID=A0A915LBD4_MELJA